jgi:hypothetical protein
MPDTQFEALEVRGWLGDAELYFVVSTSLSLNGVFKA